MVVKAFGNRLLMRHILAPNETISHKNFDHYWMNEHITSKPFFNETPPCHFGLFLCLFPYRIDKFSAWRIVTKVTQSEFMRLHLIFSASICVREDHFSPSWEETHLCQVPNKKATQWALVCSARFASLWNVPRTSFLLQWRPSCTWMPSKDLFNASKIG